MLMDERQKMILEALQLLPEEARTYLWTLEDVPGFCFFMRHGLCDACYGTTHGQCFGCDDLVFLHGKGETHCHCGEDWPCGEERCGDCNGTGQVQQYWDTDGLSLRSRDALGYHHAVKLNNVEIALWCPRNPLDVLDAAAALVEGRYLLDGTTDLEGFFVQMQQSTQFRGARYTGTHVDPLIAALDVLGQVWKDK